MMAINLMIFGFLLGIGHLIVNVQSDSQPKCLKSSDEIQLCDRGCAQGFYGLNCSQTCSENCNASCSQDTGTCLTGCYPKWFESNCTRKCPGFCLYDICDMRNGDCIHRCIDGYYGTACDKTCSGNCTDGVCDEYGGCTCQKGVEDMACYLDCSDNCLDGECAMDPNGRLQCLKGCQTGRTGPFCQEWCQGNCTKCASNGICIDGDSDILRAKRSVSHCQHATDRKCDCCQNGWTGKECDNPCKNCIYHYGENVCRESCEGGYFGYLCNQACFNKCSANYEARPVCAKDTGKCHSGCVPGYYGFTCRNTCSTSCKGGKCYQNGTCVNCTPKKYGPRCEYECGHCNGSCRRDGRCDCLPGWYGLKCNHRCSVTCKSEDCRVDVRGNHLCLGECDDRYTGDDCRSRCPLGCEKCDKKKGNCKLAITAPVCTDGGSECGSHGSCNTSSTTYVCDCTGGYSGATCTTAPVCTDGGNECGSHGSCNTGSATYVCDCTGGYSGATCDIPLIGVGGVIAIVAAFALIALVIALVWFRKKIISCKRRNTQLSGSVELETLRQSIEETEPNRPKNQSVVPEENPLTSCDAHQHGVATDLGGPIQSIH